MILLILIVAILLCALVVYLPYSAGLTHIERNTQSSHPAKKQNNLADDGGYIPPDELWKREQEEKDANSLRARASALKDRINVTNDDVPLKIRLNQDTVLRRRHEKVVGDNNPNNYDYDLDELIEEETAGAAKERAAEFYAHEQVGGDKEAMV